MDSELMKEALLALLLTMTPAEQDAMVNNAQEWREQLETNPPAILVLEEDDG